MAKEWESSEFWTNYGQGDYYNDRLKLITKLIPEDDKTVVDIGCGKAEIINSLSNNLFVVGVDYSITALSYNKKIKLNASSTDIPLRNNTFDMAICLEVIEHLSDEAYQRTLYEIQRVSKKHIIIGVPFDEDINLRKVKCPQCGFVFNCDGHIRKFTNSDSIDCKLEKFKKTHTIITGPKTYYPPSSILNLLQTNGIYSPWDKHLVCSQCNYSDQQIYQIENKIIYKGLRGLKYFGKSAPYWMILMYERDNHGRN
jgi:ubiquinone/menaquinone biosynthesis C-methylase UbiE